MTVRPWPILLLSLVAAGVVFAVVVLSFIAGAAWGQYRLYLKRIDQEQEWVEARLNGKPEFANVMIWPRSKGGVELGGYVTSQEDLDRLRSEMVQAVGEYRTDESFYVEVVTAPTQKSGPASNR